MRSGGEQTYPARAWSDVRRPCVRLGGVLGFSPSHVAVLEEGGRCPGSPAVTHCMQPITPEALAMVQDDAPDVIARVQRANQHRRHRSIRLTLDRFDDNPILLYACLWYAATSGVAITIAPRRSRMR